MPSRSPALSPSPVLLLALLLGALLLAVPDCATHPAAGAHPHAQVHAHVHTAEFCDLAGPHAEPAVQPRVRGDLPVPGSEQAGRPPAVLRPVAPALLIPDTAPRAVSGRATLCTLCRSRT
ncbi:hypothetical protein [Streptomyces sp. NPDC002054]|uniref:hypothetical protein n=1 Tax=Streptomyces sp. NPDC002054 TaxID=3154663 RepID=UPI00331AA4C4